MVVERHDDPYFVQRRVDGDGVTYCWGPETAGASEMNAALAAQEDMFKAKFGREMGADDPIFFDPDTDTPMPLSMDTAFEGIREAAERAGVDVAYIDAWQEVGYMVTEANKHTFSHAEVMAWEQAVGRHLDHDN